MQSNSHQYHWLTRRGITDHVMDMFALSIGNHGSMSDCIVIPVNDEFGNLLYNKYRRDPLDDRKPKYIYDRGGSVQLYGIGFAKTNKKILITEGEMDALVAWSAYIPAVSSTGGALSFQKEWATHFSDKEVVICFDNDHAGGEGMVKTLKIIPHAQILFLPDAPNIKDISDYVQHGGNLHALMETAKRFQSDQDIIEDRAQRIALFKSTFFHDAWIDALREEENKIEHPKNRTRTPDIIKAKEYPITKLLRFTQHKAKCLWHSEKNASMHYYATTNTCYCFGCGKRADAIDIYRALYSCSFKEAVKNLS